METTQWFVLRDLKRHNARYPAWQSLPEKGFEVFTPMVEQIVEISGRKRRITRPVLPDLLFVRSTFSALEAEMQTTPTLQFRFMKGAAYRTPMTVRNDDMDRFITAVRSAQSPAYFLPEEITPDKIGRTIRVVDGPLAGYEGTLLKVRGSRKRRLLVSLENYLVAAIEIQSDFIEFT